MIEKKFINDLNIEGFFDEETSTISYVVYDNKSKKYQLLNTTIGYSKANLSAEFWIRNVFDKYYSTRGFYFGNEAPDFIDTLYRRQGDPKNIGLSIRYDF